MSQRMSPHRAERAPATAPVPPATPAPSESFVSPEQGAEPVQLVQPVVQTLELGQGLIEYALIIFLVAIVVIAILLLLGPQIGAIFSQIYATI